MRPGRALLIFALVVFAGGALLAPWLYWAVQWAAGQVSALEGLARNPFHRFVNRALLGLALLGLWPLARSLGACSWADLGWTKPQGQGRRVGFGFALGFLSLAAVVGLAWAAGAREPRTDLTAARLGSKLLSAALSAVVVALLEETFFRGAIQGALRRAHSWPVALGLSSAIYALVHFFQRPASPAVVHWSSGLQILPEMLRGFVDWPSLVPGFFTLTLAGLILGLAYQRTGSLYFSCGLHAGWIFWLKFSGAITAVQPEANTWLWGSGRLIDGWVAVPALGAVFLLLWRRMGPPPASPHEPRVDSMR
jgi:uncharacterized protein